MPAYYRDRLWVQPKFEKANLMQDDDAVLGRRQAELLA
jgi:hypothetical protein